MTHLSLKAQLLSCCAAQLNKNFWPSNSVRVFYDFPKLKVLVHLVLEILTQSFLRGKAVGRGICVDLEKSQ